jgi:excisionase family DNA binding protein
MSNAETNTAIQSGTTVADNPPASTGAIGPRGVRIVEKVYLTIDEASELSGLSKDYLRSKIKSAELKSLSDGVDKVRRADVERL